MGPIFHVWADDIARTGLSKWLAAREWLIADSQSVHIVMLSIVFGCVVLINLRLLGLSVTGRPLSQLVRTLVPWIYAALIVLLITGVLQTVAEPLREFITPAFWAKMAMIIAVVLLTEMFRRSVAHNASRWDDAHRRPHGAWLLAVISLGLWIAIIFCGRFIGYTWQLYT